jgi:hypothetical protein
LDFQNVLFAAGFLEIILNFKKCQNAPFRASFLGMITSKPDQEEANTSKSTLYLEIVRNSLKVADTPS